MNILQKAIQNFAIKTGSIPLVDHGGGHNYFELVGSSGFDGMINYTEIDDDTLVNMGYAINTDVYAIINKIVECATDIPLSLYHKTNEGLIKIEEGELYELLKNPNDSQTMKEFRGEAYGNILMTGDMFLRGETAVGFGNAIQQLTVLASNCTDITIQAKGVILNYRYTSFGIQEVIPVEEVWHGMYHNPTKVGMNNIRGLSPLEAGYRALIASNELIQAESVIFKNGGVNGMLTSGTDKNAGEVETRLIQEAVNKRLGGSNKANGIAATNANLKYVQFGMSPQQLQLIKSSPIKLRALCRVYSVDSSLFGDNESKTFANRKEAEKSLYTNACIPLNNRFISYLDRFLLPSWRLQEGVNYVIKQDLSEIEALAADQKTVAEKNNIVTQGVLNVISSPISQAAKVDMLVNIHGYTEEGAILLVTPPENNDNQSTNDEGTNE